MIPHEIGKILSSCSSWPCWLFGTLLPAHILTIQLTIVGK